MKKLTTSQAQEISFLQKEYMSRVASVPEIQDYIEATVYGKRTVEDKLSTNPLRHAKQRLNVNVTMWRKDIIGGLLSVEEFKDYFSDPFGKKLIDSIIKSIK